MEDGPICQIWRDDDEDRIEEERRLGDIPCPPNAPGHRRGRSEPEGPSPYLPAKRDYQESREDSGQASCHQSNRRSIEDAETVLPRLQLSTRYLSNGR